MDSFELIRIFFGIFVGVFKMEIRFIFRVVGWLFCLVKKEGRVERWEL